MVSSDFIFNKKRMLRKIIIAELIVVNIEIIQKTYLVITFFQVSLNQVKCNFDLYLIVINELLEFHNNIGFKLFNYFSFLRTKMSLFTFSRA